MIVLGVDTSTARSSVAVLDARDDRLLAAAAHEDARGHGAFLAPAIARCLAEAGLTVTDLDGVAVGTGPGLYTGLRIGMATATALAWARGVPVAGVVGTDAVALAARRDLGVDGPLVVVLDARRGQWFHATYVSEGAGGARGSGPSLGDAAAVAAALAAAGADARAVGELAGSAAPVPAAAVAGVLRPDAADVARLAVADLRAGGTPRAALVPRYLREADVRIGWTERGSGVVQRLRAPVGDADRAALLALEVATEVRPLGWDALSAEAGLAVDEGCLLVLREGGAVAGFASARVLAGTAHVLRLTVAADRRRRGHGRALLAGLVAWAREAGASEVTLEVRAGNAAARSLYAVAGFTEVGRRPRYYPDGEDAVLMTVSMSALAAPDGTAR